MLRGERELWKSDNDVRDDDGEDTERESLHISTAVWFHAGTKRNRCYLRSEAIDEDQRGLHCVFIDLENAYDTVPRPKEVDEKYTRLIQDMCHGSRTKVRMYTCTVGTTEDIDVRM